MKKQLKLSPRLKKSRFEKKIKALVKKRKEVDDLEEVKRRMATALIHDVVKKVLNG